MGRDVRALTALPRAGSEQTARNALPGSGGWLPFGGALPPRDLQPPERRCRPGLWKSSCSRMPFLQNAGCCRAASTVLLSLTRAHTLSYCLTPSLSHAHTHTVLLALCLMHTRTVLLALSLTHTHTVLLALSLTHTLISRDSRDGESSPPTRSAAPGRTARDSLMCNRSVGTELFTYVFLTS